MGGRYAADLIVLSSFGTSMTPSANSDRHTRPVVVVLGGSGSGKGTHGQAVAAALGYQHLSSGEHFRDHIRRQTPLGRRAREFIKNGQLVPDEVAGELAAAMLGGCPSASGFVLDGFPRSLAQAEALEGIVSEIGGVVAQTLYLDISDDEMVRRLSSRLTCRACGRTCHENSKPPARPGVCDACGGELFRRADDEPVTIWQRVALFHRMIIPLLDFYRETGRLVEITAEGPVWEVSARAIEAARLERKPSSTYPTSANIKRIEIAVLGAGNMGTAMAHALAGHGHEVALWDFFPEVVENIRQHRENKRFLPGVRLHAGIRPTASAGECVAGWFAGPSFMPGTTTDVAGAALGGILKNVYAILLGGLETLSRDPQRQRA
jgi:adenylate kinase